MTRAVKTIEVKNADEILKIFGYKLTVIAPGYGINAQCECAGVKERAVFSGEESYVIGYMEWRSVHGSYGHSVSHARGDEGPRTRAACSCHAGFSAPSGDLSGAFFKWCKTHRKKGHSISMEVA